MFLAPKGKQKKQRPTFADRRFNQSQDMIYGIWFGDGNLG